MAVRVITLSDGGPCEVLVLPLFALDDIEPADPGDFTYTIKTLAGEEYTVFYNPPASPPPPPKDDADKWGLIEHVRYKAYVAHIINRLDLAEQRAINCGHRVLERCLTAQDRARIIEADDYIEVYRAAYTRKLGKDDLAATLRQPFQGSV